MTHPYSASRTAQLDRLTNKIYSMILDGKIDGSYCDALVYAHQIESDAMPLLEDITKNCIEIMNFLKDCAGVSSRKNGLLSIGWLSPSGFPVIQTCEKMKPKKYEVSMSKRTKMKPRTFTLREPTGKPDTMKHKNGITANLIHSCDAAHLVRTVNNAVKEGIHSFMMIHDCYCTHAARCDDLARILRETFVEMYDSEYLLTKFKEEIEGQINEKHASKLPATPKQGTFDIKEVLESTYFFS